MTLDEPYPDSDEQLRELASVLGQVPHSIVIDYEMRFGGEQSPEYYRGLLTGYAKALALAQHDLKRNEADLPTLRVAVAFIADRLLKIST